MTLSIVGRDENTGCLGIATATGMIAVGAQVPHCVHGLGAIITQGFATSPLFAKDGLALLQQGLTAQDVMEAVVSRDEGRDYRQMAVMDRHGGTAAWTGRRNDDYKAHHIRENLIVAGNILKGPKVLSDMQACFLENGSADLGERLIEALRAGQDSGGDVRGICSAALVLDDGQGAALDLRIDYSEEPVGDLAALYERSKGEAYRAFLKRLPDRENPHRY